MKNDIQLNLFGNLNQITELDSRLWRGSYNEKESTIQQLSPYVGKMKSGMANVLIQLYSKPNEIVFDPFNGSGVVPFEAAINGRIAWANDLNLYAYTLTKGKLETPKTKKQALKLAYNLLNIIEKTAQASDFSDVPEWVQEFFHPRTLQEVLAAFDILKRSKNYFILSCLLGILQHVRPGFLSYPSSHLVPYLRKSKYPPEKFPAMYTYRDLRSRLIAKIERAYKRPFLTENWENRRYQVWQKNVMDLPLTDKSVDTIISSPPYFGALDYARDNRLRLWFLGCKDWKELDKSLTANNKVYISQMANCLKEMGRVLKTGGNCVLVLGDVEKNGKTKNTAEILGELAKKATDNKFNIEKIYSDKIPDDRRSRRKTKTTKIERILVLKKQ